MFYFMCSYFFFFFFKQKTAYEMRISDWSSDVCSSDLEITPLHRCSREAFAGPADGSSRCFPPQRSRPAMPRRRPADTGAASMRACSSSFETRRTPIEKGGDAFVMIVGRRAPRRGGSSDERRGGKEGVRTIRSRWSPDH